MPRSHVCLHCGFDLALIRAQRDARLGLNLVTCPGCGTVAARRRHPFHAWLREVRRLDWTLGLLVVQMALLGLFTVLTTLGAMYTAEELLTRPLERQVIEIATIHFALPLALGVWLTAGFPHQRRWRCWLGWGAWMLFIGLLALVFEFIITFGYLRHGTYTYAEQLALTLGGLSIHETFVGGLYVLWQLAVALLGIPAGLFLAWMFRAIRGMMFRYRLRRHRSIFHQSTRLPSEPLLQAAPHRDDAREFRAGCVLDVRACRVCAQPLDGEPIVRDEATRLHVARCPACGAYEALEAYPLAPALGAHVRPWCTVGWLVILLALSVPTVGYIMAVGTMFAEDETRTLINPMTELVNRALWQETHPNAADFDQPQTVTLFREWRNNHIQSLSLATMRHEWVRENGLATIFHEQGGWWRMLTWSRSFAWMLPLTAYALVGMVWSILLLGVSPFRRAAALIGMVLLGALCLAPLIVRTTCERDRQHAHWLDLAVYETVLPWLFAFSVLGFALALAAGALVGGSIARAFIRVMLAPALRYPLRGLWSAAGHPFPNPASSRRASRRSP